MSEKKLQTSLPSLPSKVIRNKKKNKVERKLILSTKAQTPP